jgi:hypothetical protein
MAIPELALQCGKVSLEIVIEGTQEVSNNDYSRTIVGAWSLQTRTRRGVMTRAKKLTYEG